METSTDKAPDSTERPEAKGCDRHGLCAVKTLEGCRLMTRVLPGPHHRPPPLLPTMGPNSRLQGGKGALATAKNHVTLPGDSLLMRQPFPREESSAESSKGQAKPGTAVLSTI